MGSKWVRQLREESTRIGQFAKRGGGGASQEAERNTGVLNGTSANHLGVDLEQLGFVGA